VPELAFLDLPGNVMRVPWPKQLERTIGVAIMPTGLRFRQCGRFQVRSKHGFESTLPPLRTFIKIAKAKGSAGMLNECP